MLNKFEKPTQRVFEMILIILYIQLDLQTITQQKESIMNRQFSSYLGSQTTRSRLRSNSPTQLKNLEFVIKSAQQKFKSQQSTPIRGQQIVAPLKPQNLDMFSTASEIRKLRVQSMRSQSQIDNKIIWNQVQDQLEKKTGACAEFEKLRNNSIYRKLREMKFKENEEKKLHLERRLQRELLAKNKNQELQNNQAQRQIETKRQPKFQLSTIVNALTLIQIHSKTYSMKLAKLIAKNYLNILDYNNYMEQKRLNENQSSQNTPRTPNLEKEQILEIQDLVNGGIHQIIIANKTKKHREQLKASEIFSEDVLRRVRLLQSCFHLKVFSKKSKSHKYRRQQIIGVPSTRVKAQTRRLGDIKFMNQYSPKSNKPGTMLNTNNELKQNKKSLRLFRSLTKGSLTTQKSLFFNRQNTNEFLLKGVQMLHYPIIKYISIFYKNMVVWSISYKDITLDKSCIVLFFKGEGKYKYRYRLDVPIGQNPMINYNENCLTVWPTVRDYLISYLHMKGQLALLDQKQLPTAQVYKLNFIKGLTDRSRMKITSLDIHGITETKKILDYLQKSQIVKIKKVFGTVYELLPQFIEVNKYGQKKQYIVNLPLVHNIVLQLRMFEEQLLLQKRSLGEVEENLIDRYSSFLCGNTDYINQILMFRFIHNNPDFFQDQMLKDIHLLQEKSIYIQSATLKLNDILQVESNTDHISYGSYCLLSIFLTINCSVNLKLLLLDVSDKSMYTNLSDTINLFEYVCKKRNQLQLIFNQEYFQFQIKVTFHERDEAGYNRDVYSKNLFADKKDRQTKQLVLSVNEWLKLCKAIKNSVLVDDSEQYFDFNKLVKSILLEQPYHSRIVEETLKSVFCISLKKEQVILKASYKHILSVSYNFIEQLDHYNFSKNLGYVHKYSVYPTEYHDIKQIIKEQKKSTLTSKDAKQFNKQFKQINTADIKLTNTNTKISLIVDYQYEYHISQSIPVDCNQLQLISYCQFRRNHFVYQIVNNRDSMKIIIQKFFKAPIIIKIEDIDLIFKILNCQHLSTFLLSQELLGCMHQIQKKNSFLTNNLQFFIQKHKYPLPSYKQIKFMLINDSDKLLNYLDRLSFMFLFKQTFSGSQILVHAKIYFICKDSHTRSDEKIYFFHSEDLFLGLEIQEFKSKLKKYIIILNKFDLEKLFDIKGYLDISIVHYWCKTIINNLSFDKQNIYRLPYLQNLNHYIIPKLDDEEENHRLKAQRSMTNDYKHDEQNTVCKQFLLPQIKLFRVIGHYIMKYYLLKNSKKVKLATRLPQQFHNEFDSYTMEYIIITIQAHNIFDMFRIMYYFPKSRRRLMTHISILQFQEMDFRDNLIFDLLEYNEYKTYQDIEVYVKSQKCGIHFKHSIQLDKQVLTRIKFMKQSVDIQNPFQFAFKKNQNNFLKVSDDLITKNRYLLSQIKQNQQLSDKVIKFMQFTRKLNNDLQFELQNKLIEIKIWELLLNQVFELKFNNSKSINNYIHLIDRLIQTFDQKKRNQVKIIGKEYLLKKQSSGALKNNYTVQSNVTQLYTRLILTNNIKVTEKLNFPDTDINLNIGFLQYPLLEFICSQEIKLERLGNAYLECFIEQIKKTQQNQQVFYPQQLISYSQSSDFNIYLRYYCLQNLKYKDIRLNMRELLNLFIADGFFKSKTNYMNSRLSQSDIQNMCYYLVQKIRDQNYLNLSSLVLLKKERKFSLASQILLETQDSLIPNQNNSTMLFDEGYLYTQSIKGNKCFQILQLQIFPSTKKIIVNLSDSKAILFQQKIYTFQEAEELVMNFLILFQSKNVQQALKRLAKALEYNLIQMQKI
ncbi:unnamed protein product (macronuclear) [Paramecium tetraurelia]|uniref:Uncharacterized protein n=1 Tax=Paramecium tetraurelia TaxID=5888 RepID=A0CZY9_PARTE|nr:uncharacterized protein GSPATT00011930001 [Paramecium tetraurelia]CAK76356.1 unnamed protein product [Paramecium tetraurelia]|eukprot:XP_001443753.1 hypothetical protein (macronuclear) [Paramecium tetraurelia strain d4-2]